MKVGDLVKLLNDPEVHRNNGEIPPDAIGIVVEEELADHARGSHGPLWSVWVNWFGRWDWDSMFVEDLKIISEARGS